MAATDVTPTNAMDLASQLDREWFDVHPGARSHRRPAIPGEFGAPGGDLVGCWIEVTVVAPGIRHKRVIGGAP